MISFILIGYVLPVVICCFTNYISVVISCFSKHFFVVICSLLQESLISGMTRLNNISFLKTCSSIHIICIHVLNFAETNKNQPTERHTQANNHICFKPFTFRNLKEQWKACKNIEATFSITSHHKEHILLYYIHSKARHDNNQSKNTIK